jgi:hypothetical protein
MAIGGGEDGQYIVYATPDNQRFYKVVNPKAPPGKRLLVAGGQRGDYDRKICIGLADAITAAKMYAETGQYDPTLFWEE